MNTIKELATPFAIVIGFGMVAAALYVTGGATGASAKQSDQALAPQTGQSVERIAEARIYGDINAPVTIVEFSDVECPFCGRLHPTLKRLVDESAGEINWEYRHLPLPSHRNAVAGAVASECVATLAGDKSFWDYLDILFANQGGHSQAFYTDAAVSLGIEAEDFNVCMSSEAPLALVQQDAETAQALGGQGTPFSVIVFADGSTRPVSGALPYEQWKSLLTL